ncbi:MAG: SDR family NAD(P)-dependent oxidoreductase, partial [Actinobacteria bacterium]|nr:SDR family NAD(P)-dependent oxidoreductase [Actinomycetota bacterium]
MRLGGRVCVVTGATSGIGRALAVAFVGEGAHVWALGRSRERM